MPNPLATPAPAAPTKEEVTFENDIIFHALTAHYQTTADIPAEKPFADLKEYDINKGQFEGERKENYQDSLEKKDTFDQRGIAYDSIAEF